MRWEQTDYLFLFPVRDRTLKFVFSFNHTYTTVERDGHWVKQRNKQKKKTRGVSLLTLNGSATDSLDWFSCACYKSHTFSLFQFVKSPQKSDGARGPGAGSLSTWLTADEAALDQSIIKAAVTKVWPVLANSLSTVEWGKSGAKRVR